MSSGSVTAAPVKLLEAAQRWHDVISAGRRSAVPWEAEVRATSASCQCEMPSRLAELAADTIPSAYQAGSVLPILGTAPPLPLTAPGKFSHV